MDRALRKGWPQHDVSKPLSDVVFRYYPDADSKILFADDAKASDGYKMHYAIGLSYVTVNEFESYRIPNGSIRKNLRWSFVDSFKKANGSLAAQLSEAYSDLRDDIAAIVVCKLFDRQAIHRELDAGYVPYSSEIFSRIVVTDPFVVKDKGKKRTVPVEDQFREYLYKQHVGDVVKEEIVNRFKKN